MPRINPCRPDACTSAAQAPRQPYQSDRPLVYPPVPDRCPKCRGCLTRERAYYDVPATVFCINCGWRLCPIPLPQEPDMMKSGPVLQNIIEVRR